MPNVFLIPGGSTTAVSNGGKSQVNFDSTTFAFMDLIKSSPNWNNGGGVNANGQVTPANMDANGYPTTIGTNGYYTTPTFPPTTIRPGNYVLVWTGGDVTTAMRTAGSGIPSAGSFTGSIASGVLSIPGSITGTVTKGMTLGGVGVTASTIIGAQLTSTTWQLVSSVTGLNSSQTLGSVSMTTSGGGYSGANGRVVFIPNVSATQFNVQIGPTTIGSPYISSISVVHVDDEAAWLQGEIFGAQFRSVLSAARFGVYRFLNWQPSQTSITNWASRKPSTYFSFTAQEYRASLWAGTTTHVGNDYSISFSSGAPADKQTILLQFDANATFNSGTVTFPGASVVNWTAHGLSAGDVVGFNGGSPPTGIFYGGTYYVIAAGLGANSFEISLTPGGSAYNYGGAAVGGGMIGVRLATLNLNTTGKVAIMTPSAATPTDSGAMPATTVGGIAIFATLVYDADLNSWLLYGGCSDNLSSGIINGCPYEIMLQLCKELGAHPWFVSPYLAVDPMTDFHTQLATLVKTTMPSWMVPRFETCNELWNTINPMTQYAFQKAYVHWNTQFSAGIFDNHDWVGKTASTMGQAVNAVYGGAVGVGYQSLIGVQKVDFASPGANGSGNRFTASNYVNQSASAQVGYTKSASSNWATHADCDNYFTTTERNTGQEATDAATYASNAAQIVGSISGGTLTVGSVTSGTLVIGQTINDQYGLIPAGVTITAGGGSSWTVSNGAISIISGTVIFAQNATATALATSYADTASGVASTNAGGNLAQVKIYITNLANYAASLTNNAGHALKTTLYEGGYAVDFDSTAQINAFRNGSKMVADVGKLIGGGTLASAAVVAGNYADDIAAGAEFPSLFQLAGTNNTWSALDPDIYATPTTAQWNAIVAFNH